MVIWYCPLFLVKRLREPLSERRPVLIWWVIYSDIKLYVHVKTSHEMIVEGLIFDFGQSSPCIFRCNIHLILNSLWYCTCRHCKLMLKESYMYIMRQNSKSGCSWSLYFTCCRWHFLRWFYGCLCNSCTCMYFTKFVWIECKFSGVLHSTYMYICKMFC